MSLPRLSREHPLQCSLHSIRALLMLDASPRYVVIDLMNGGDLRFHITRKTFTEDAVRFWIAELGCALRYVHQQGIVHRDVKPDNVLLDSEGHVHLADFNVASDYTPNRALTSKSGTLAYLAPEVYAGKGYLSEVDWWSLGVTFYECIFNKRPFDSHYHDALAKSIQFNEPKFPMTSPPVAQLCLHAISSLLEKDRRKRIGASSWESFIHSPFFQSIDFDALERKQVEPVFCPSSEKTNFDATYDLEELLLEEAPLEARARKQKPRAELREDATKQEIRADELHRMIETMFEPFNYTLLPQERPVAATTTTTDVQRSSSHDSKFASVDQECPLSPPPPPPTTTRATRYDRSNVQPLPPPGSPRSRSSSQVSGRYSPHARSVHPIAAATENGSIRASPLGFHHARSSPSVTSHPSGRHDHHPGTRSASLGDSFIPPVPAIPTASFDDHRSPPHPTPSRRTDPKSSSTGVFDFLTRKRGRERSPRIKDRERGVLGKEGARHVISSG